MSKVRVIRKSSGHHKKRHRNKMTIHPVGADWKIVVPYAPREVTHSALSAEWEEVRRTARRPFIARSNDPQPRMSFTLIFGDEDPDKRYDDDLRKLTRIARGERPVRVNYSTWETGNWRITSLSFNSIMRHHRTDEITRAEAQVELMFIGSMSNHMGPLTGGVKKTQGKKKDHGDHKGRKPKRGSGKPRHYKVKRGDTLSEIAVKFYRDASMWRKIADANKIRNPRKLPVGKVLRLP